VCRITCFIFFILLLKFISHNLNFFHRIASLYRITSQTLELAIAGLYSEKKVRIIRYKLRIARFLSHL